MPYNCCDCKVELRDTTNDPNKCSDGMMYKANGFLDWSCQYCGKEKDVHYTSSNYCYAGPYVRCHNCITWGPSRGDGDNPWYKEKACEGCKRRLVDGRFKAADMSPAARGKDLKALAAEMKAILAPQSSAAEAEAKRKAEAEAKKKAEAAREAEAKKKAEAAAQGMGGLSLGGAQAGAVPAQGVANPSLDPAAPAARSLASSRFKAIYEGTECPKRQPKLLGPVLDLILCYCQQRSIPEAEGDRFYTELEKEAFERKDEVLGEVPAAAQRLWTSGKKLEGVEFCSMLNFAIRSDDGELMKHACPILRAINTLLVTRGVRDAKTVPFPPSGMTFRGGALPPEHMPFFERMRHERTMYRVPGLLATSFVRVKAKHFALQAENRGESAVLWIIHMPPDGKDDETMRCRHVNFIERTHFEDEKEFLFAAYAPFKVKAIKWAPQQVAFSDDPHVIELEACLCGKREREDLPLAPWY